MARWGELNILDNGTQYRHVKTGGIYTLIHEGLEVTGDEAVPSVVYQNEDGDIFIQAKARFFDGRFEEL